MLFKALAALAILTTTTCAALPGYHEPWGKDAGLALPRAPTPPPDYAPLERMAHRAILFHQNVISKADGPRSHFRPTSSRYTLLAMQQFGLWRGFLMGCDRLMRENGEIWVYRTIEINGKLYKHDPVLLHLGHQARELLHAPKNN